MTDVFGMTPEIICSAAKTANFRTLLNQDRLKLLHLS